MAAPFRRVAVIGTTRWGTTLAVQLGRNAVPTVLAARTPEEATRLAGAREHRDRLPGIAFPDALSVATTAEAIADADLVCLVVPSQSMAANLEAIRDVVAPSATILSATKGIELESGRRMSELVAEALPGRQLAVLSGPNLSREVASGLPSTTVIASEGPTDALRDAFHSRTFRVYTSPDVVGVELGGALKNVVAIAGGIVDAFQFGNNAKAAILTRGLAEMTRLAVAAGADPLTLQGLAGIGDLMATAYSPLSRNRHLGELLGGGASLDDALATIGETAEGARTVPAALRLAAPLDVELPVTEGLDAIMYRGVAPADAIEALLAREPTAEIR
jgi:glycerol-3-phosphate dehydrogenase (NAD(P)+)